MMKQIGLKEKDETHLIIVVESQRDDHPGRKRDGVKKGR